MLNWKYQGSLAETGAEEGRLWCLCSVVSVRRRYMVCAKRSLLKVQEKGMIIRSMSHPD